MSWWLSSGYIPPRRSGLHHYLMAVVALFIISSLWVAHRSNQSQGWAGAATSYPSAIEPLRSLSAAKQWLNGSQSDPSAFKNKVILVNFWTFSCINCLRVLPHLKAWSQKYKDQGLMVIGVQTPEFAFEKNVGSVSKAVVSLGVDYPIAIDNDFAIWRSFTNDAWPALYFIGTDGIFQRRVLGEGEYDESERVIQRMLSEAGKTRVASALTTVNGHGPQEAADEKDLRSSETYIGYAQARDFESPGFVREGGARAYQAPTSLSLNHWSLAGNWTINAEFAAANEPNARILFRFHARDLHLVLANPTPNHPIRFRVKIDGASPGADHGFDVDADGWGSLQSDRLYQLIRQSRPILDRTFEIEFFQTGVRAYSFTFG